MAFDIYCAICSVPSGVVKNGTVRINDKPRSAWFQKRLEATFARRLADNVPDHKYVYIETVEDQPPTPPGERREDDSYDPAILTHDDIAWADEFYAVALRTYDQDSVKG
jgi:hypothetical protein